MVPQICCDACYTVFVLEPEEQSGLERLRGEQLALAAWPLAHGGGWERTESGGYRCPQHAAQYGVGALSERPGLLELLRTARLRDPDSE